ncbi:DUF6122 family protein [Kangiella sp. TOML190]|uniref:DUF6122 family protein n=1 Tax=Kangiella sp. TOML190 TaxID=2931351 RepID=UPI0020405A10|nr:DUF6122 family protein [Kangiella sp. TOML190]
MHIFLHFAIPLLVALLFFRKQWQKAFIIMILAMLIDIDHLLAAPIYDASRCSIGFHPLHTIIPITAYFLMCFFKKTRLIGIGLMIHIILDSIDCQMTNGVWWV